MRWSSLELSWLRNELKGVRLPLVVFRSCTADGGAYYRPARTEILIDDRHYPLDRGLIVVASAWPDNFAGTIAHEWRHHWQFDQGWRSDSLWWSNPGPEQYDAAIREYFTRSRSEWDALRFERRKAKTEANEYCVALLTR